MIYMIVVYDPFGESLRRIPEKDRAVAEMVRDYFADDYYKSVIYETEISVDI